VAIPKEHEDQKSRPRGHYPEGKRVVDTQGGRALVAGKTGGMHSKNSRENGIKRGEP